LEQLIVVQRERKKQEKEKETAKHIHFERMHVRSHASFAVLRGQKTGTEKQQFQRNPQAPIVRKAIVEIMHDKFKERLVDVARILSTAVAVHTIECFAAVLAMRIGRPVGVVNPF